MLSQPNLQPLLRFVWKNSAFYRRLYREHGIHEEDLGHITLGDLPVITKRMVLDNFDEVVTDPRIRHTVLEEWLEHDHDPRNRFLGEYLVVRSSGSSGVQANIVYHATTWRSMTMTAAASLYPEKPSGYARYRSAFYIGEPDHLASATAAMNSSLGVFDVLVVSMRDPIEETIARLNSFQPERLTTYSSSLGWLADLALSGRLRISPRDVVVSSDPLLPAVEAQIRKLWNPNIYDLYAAVEGLFMAVRQPGQAEWKVLEELQSLEVLDGDNRQGHPGEMGRVVMTSWINRTLPLIRYDLTDIVICGETRPGSCTLRRFVGRLFDHLPVRMDGGAAGEIPSYAIANFGMAGLDMFQFVSHSPDEVELQYTARQEMDGPLAEATARMLMEWGASKTKFHVRRVDHIWNDALTHKLRQVRPADRPQHGLPARILNRSTDEANAGEALRAGGGFVPFSRAQLEESLAAVFERQVARSPQATAIKDGTLCMTYADLHRAAGRAAAALHAAQMDPSHPVALLFSHKAAMVTAILGVIMAGGWYVPLDPSHPEARNMAILREVEAGLVLTDDESLASVRTYGFTEHQIINLDKLDEVEVGVYPRQIISPGLPACVLYTSGSTGRPKGVVLDNRAVLHRAMLYTNDYAIGPADRLALLQSYVFNASLREIFGALLNGGGLYLYSLKRDGVHHLAKWLMEEGITVLYMVPATWRVFLESLKGERFERLRLIRLGGEAVLARDVQGFQRNFGPGCTLANGLASTETGTICQFFFNHQTPIVGSRAPVGWAVQDKMVSLLDEQECPVAEGVVGEIVVTSAYMGLGAFSGNMPETQPAGVSRVVHTGDLGCRLPDGRIELVGRKDWQVKLRGQRMNLLEIEQALLSLENVAEAAVTLQTGEDGTAFLAAYLQPKALPAPDEDELRRGLRSLLPEVMVPAVFLFLDQLPRMVGGKVDRQALPAVGKLAPVRKPVGLLKTPTEQMLAEIWCELLGIEQVGAEDSFFDLGGDSLLASTLMARIETRFQRRFPLAILFQQDTLRVLAAAIEAQDGKLETGLLVTIQPLGNKPPVFFIPGIGGEVLALRDLALNLGVERPLLGLQGADYGESARKYKTIEQAADQYASLVRAVLPHGPYNLVGYSFGGHLALEIARRLADSDEEQPLVVLIDTYPPVPRRNTTLVNRMRIHFDNLRRLNNAGEAAGYLRDRLQRIYLWLIRHRRLRKIASQISAPVSPTQIALATYKPTPYPGRVVIFKASQREWYVDWDPLDAWNEFISGELEMRTVPGDHDSLTRNPSAVELAHQLNEVLGK